MVDVIRDIVETIEVMSQRIRRLEATNPRLNLISGNEVNIGANGDERQLNITGRVEIDADVSPPSGLEAALTVDANAYSNAGGSQWASVFARVFTVSGESTLDELGGFYNALYHDKGFTLADWKGIETGGGFVDGAGSVVTQFTALEANIPTVTGGGSVVNAYAIRIPSKATTGMTNVRAISQEIASAESYFRGPINIDNVASAFEAYRDGGSTVIKASVHQSAANTGARFRMQFSRNTRASPNAVNSGDLVGRFESYAYIDGDYRLIGALESYVAGTPGAGSYPGDWYFRLVSDSATSLGTKAILSEAGDLTLGATKQTGGVGGLYAGVVAVKDGVTAPSAVANMAVIYVDTADGDLKVRFSNGFIATIAADS